ncbi:MAG TPA: glycosyltransferase family 4 protein [Candidatus Paceibacterota bacterium]|nr:glycosyltransferase family 4 protein [Candidatus Paceibacterota bacterium]
MRFLMLNWRDPENPLSGGAERVSIAYMQELVRRGHEVFWFANDFPGAAPETTIDGIRYIRGGGKGSSVFNAIQWHRTQPRFDLVIDQHHGIPWYAPWWCKTNCVAYIHEVLGPIWKSFYPWPVNAIGQAQENWTHWFYRNVPFWTPSESTRTALHANGVQSVTVIPNGCDTQPLAVLEPKPLQLPLKLISVSRLAPNKRIDHSIRATKLLNDRGIETHLTVVGTGEVETDLRGLAAELGITGRVTFTGSLPEAKKNAALQNAHFLIHCSVREGWGLNVLEANAMGTPAIVYPVGGLVDSTVPGETGIVTATESPDAAADALSSILKNPDAYTRYRNAAWERSKRFQWNVVLPQACDWLESQASRK